MCCKYAQPNRQTNVPQTQEATEESSGNVMSVHTIYTQTCCKYTKLLQILTIQANTQTKGKCSQHNQIDKHTANTQMCCQYSQYGQLRKQAK